ncbi:helix-turn-helix transcriptional regulator [Spiroplasma endosymbiont of Asaphidion curtum]|uniref:helix-turn-helix transcriptional regulator n=1 Tax=Spiroplasma endosymbiont of Asaphidion curtum TaxID=3066281 RepID=UPI00313CC969
METLIKKMRLRNGLTQTQLAKMVGVKKQPTISRLEADASHISWGLISKVLIDFLHYLFIKQNSYKIYLK